MLGFEKGVWHAGLLEHREGVSGRVRGERDHACREHGSLFERRPRMHVDHPARRVGVEADVELAETVANLVVSADLDQVAREFVGPVGQILDAGEVVEDLPRGREGWL